MAVSMRQRMRYYISSLTYRLRYALRWTSRSKGAVSGITIIGIALAIAVIGPSISPYSYSKIDLSVRLLPPLWMEGGSWQYPLGTDDLGRDTLSRMIFAVRVSLIVGGAVSILAASVGILLGLISGYYGGILDTIIMRLVDVQWSFPYLLLAIAIMSLFGTSFMNLLLVLVIGNWVSYARVVRSQVLSVKEEEFVTAAIALGAKPAAIIFRHILPNTLAPIFVLASFNLAGIILMESSLSFLGLGVPPPMPSFGGMISSGRNYLYSAWWIVTLPGVGLMILVLGVNQLGDGLRDLLDPRLRGVL